ncbi:MAG: AMP-binding protein, partial [Sciscionella sp.]
LDPGEDDDADPTAVMIATSGSTGEPKGVLIPASALRASALATHARLGGAGHWLLATPPQYIGGLQVLVRAQLAGTRPVFVDISTGFRPERFADAAGQLLATPAPHYTAIVPTQLTRLLDAGGAPLDALRAFDAVIIGAAATTERLRARAAEAGVAAVPSYGMSETASGCVYEGMPLDGVEVSLDDGEITIAGPVLARGYRRAPEQTALTFGGGRFRTGDLGQQLVGGRLEVLGRADDVINTGGVKIAPVLVERALAAEPTVADACVFWVADEQWGQAVIAAVVPASDGVDEQALADAVRAQVGRAATPKRFLVLPEIPMRGPGKPDRAVLRALLTTR